MAVRLNLYVDQGADFSKEISLETDSGAPINTANNDFFCQVRKTGTSALSFSANVSIASNTSITFAIDDANTRTVKAGKYEYDIMMRKADLELSKVLEGTLFLLPTMTVIGANT